jgi:hypothetical protein
MGGLTMNLIAGQLLDAGFGYQTVFSIVGTLHVTAFVIILLTIRRIEPLAGAGRSTAAVPPSAGALAKAESHRSP